VAFGTVRLNFKPNKNRCIFWHMYRYLIGNDEYYQLFSQYMGNDNSQFFKKGDSPCALKDKKTDFQNVIT